VFFRIDFQSAQENTEKYGATLMKHLPRKTTTFLKRLCTEFRPSNQLLVDEKGNAVPADAARPGKYFIFDKFKRCFRLLFLLFDWELQKEKFWLIKIFVIFYMNNNFQSISFTFSWKTPSVQLISWNRWRNRGHVKLVMFCIMLCWSTFFTFIK